MRFLTSVISLIVLLKFPSSFSAFLLKLPSVLARSEAEISKDTICTIQDKRVTRKGKKIPFGLDLGRTFISRGSPNYQ